MDKKRQQKKYKNKRRLKVKVLLKLIVFIILVALCLVYRNTLKIKNIYISGNHLIKDVVIIEDLEIKDFPPIFKLDKKKMKEKLLLNPLIEEVEIKKGIFGKLSIEIKESKILYFYKYNNKYITSNGVSIDNKNEYYGYPTLINFTPDTIFEQLVTGFNKVNHDIIMMISEIEYTPYKTADGKIIDDSRFTLRMNDDNTVIIDTVNIRNLNNYNTIYASLGMDEIKGVLYLDTITEDSIYFKSYETIAEEEKDKLENIEE